MANRSLGDGAVECAIRTFAGNWAGLVFRRGPAGWFEFFLDGGKQLTVRRQPGAVVLASVAVPASRENYRRLRVVGLGPVLRAYVDGEKLVQFADESRLSGQFGLLAHMAHVAFDDFVATSTLRPEETVLVRPQRPTEPLLARPGGHAELDLTVLNALSEPTPLTIQWRLAAPSGSQKESHLPTKAVDLFRGSELNWQPEGSGTAAKVRLEPGDGQLWQLK
jgi:hypothetical protein